MDDEFLEYCRLNKVEDIEKLAKEVFNKGFAILKYGEKLPQGIKPRVDVVEKTPEVTPENTKRIVTKELAKELIEKSKKDNIYDE